MTVADHGNGDVWVYEWKRDVMTRLMSTPGFDGNPVWTPDGKHIVFASMRHGGAPNLYWIRADGTGETIRLTVSKYTQYPFSFSPDGKRLAFSEQNPETRHDLWTLPIGDAQSDHPKPGKPEPFLVTPFYESWPMISPDGRWMAYESSESGHDEVYVRRFPGPGGKWMISTSTSDLGEPVWSRTRPELLYTSSQGMMVVSYTVSGDAFHPSRPQLWGAKGKITDWFDLAPDGKRFLMVQDAETKQIDPPQLTLLLNFFDELRRRAPSTGGMTH
jgi:serine/threonine-protein kinase